MPNRLELPFWMLPTFYNSHTSEMLHRICAPINTADDGDTVGIQLKLYTTDYVAGVEPVQYVYKLSATPNRLSNVYLTQLHGREINDIAKDLLLTQSIGFNSPGLFQAARALIPHWNSGSNSGSDPIYVMALPNFALLYTHNYEGKALCQDTIDQHVVNTSMLAVQTWQPETAHEKIEEVHFQERMIDIVNETVPMPCEDPLVLPHAGPMQLESALVI